MYRPPHFAIDDRDRAFALIRDWNFAVLVGQADGRPLATHLPLRLVDDDGDHPRLLGHVARGNPHWQAFDGETEALAIFQGPHTYVSPNWYVNGGLVPTWNYAAVHVGGRPRLIEDEEAVLALLADLIDHHESDATGNWSMDRLDDNLVRARIKAIVAFELPVEHLEAKWKMSQNRPAEDRAGVIAALDVRDDDMSRAVAREMRVANDQV